MAERLVVAFFYSLGVAWVPMVYLGAWPMWLYLLGVLLVLQLFPLLNSGMARNNIHLPLLFGYGSSVVYFFVSHEWETFLVTLALGGYMLLMIHKEKREFLSNRGQKGSSSWFRESSEWLRLVMVSLAIPAYAVYIVLLWSLSEEMFIAGFLVLYFTLLLVFDRLFTTLRRGLVFMAVQQVLLFYLFTQYAPLQDEIFGLFFVFLPIFLGIMYWRKGLLKKLLNVIGD